MRTIVSIASGFALCIIIEIGIGTYQSIRHPLMPIQNDGYDLIQVADESGSHRFDLRRGESKLLPYGRYRVTIPNTHISFTLWKNNKGFCDIHDANGIPVVETTDNAAVVDEVRK